MSISLKKRPNYLLSDFVKCVGLTPISQPSGVAHSPFEKKEDIPVERCASAAGFSNVQGEIEIFKDYEAGLKGILKRPSNSAGWRVN
jgi:hypothetical protein